LGFLFFFSTYQVLLPAHPYQNRKTAGALFAGVYLEQVRKGLQEYTDSGKALATLLQLC
jgi:hypothetical protein